MIFDARLVFFFLLLAVHLAVWTAVLLLAAMLVFWLVERAGYRFPSALRTIRATFAGHRRPAFYQRRYREAVDYGFEYRRSSLPDTRSEGSGSNGPEPVETQAGSLPLAAE